MHAWGFCWRCLRAGRGQSMVLLALLFPVLMGAAGLGFDMAFLYARQVRLQGMADLAALAGAVDLPDSTAAQAAAVAAASANGYPSGIATITVVTPHNGNSQEIEVVAEHPAPTLFMGILSIHTIKIHARAVARKQPGGYAIFASYSNCSDSKSNEVIDFPGSSSVVTGPVHSNSGFKMGGSSNTINGSLTYHCDKDISGSGNSFASGPTKTGTKSPPFSYSFNDFYPGQCTYLKNGDFDLSSDGPWWVGGSKSSKKLNPGVYCANGGKLVLSDSGIQGTVTLAASKEVHISGSNFDLSPYWNNVLIFSGDSGSGSEDAVKISGSGGTWRGYITATYGTVDFSGSANLSVQGSIIAWKVKLSGSSWSLTSDESGAGSLRLTQ